MARIRTIKPELWGSADIRPLSRDARLLFIGLISMADDDGRFLAATNAINGFVFPNDDLPPTKVRRWLAELIGNGVVHSYVVDGIEYACIPTWHRHQVINRHTASRFPAPDCECYPRTHGGLSEDSVSPHVPTHDRKGREGKGIGMEAKSKGVVTSATPSSDPSKSTNGSFDPSRLANVLDLNRAVR